MSRTKKFYDQDAGTPDLKFIDDIYHYQQWLENKIKFGDPPIISNCCKSSITFIKGHNYCTKCNELAGIK